MRATGQSMNPYYGEDAILLVDQTHFTKLKAGMMVVYVNELGENVGHLVTEKTEAGWIAQGANNDRYDPTLVTAKNFIGIIFGVFNTSGLPQEDTLASANIASTPLVIGKQY